MRKSIVFASLDAGGGHTAPAHSIEAALRQRYGKRFGTRVLDFAQALGCLDFDRRHKESWNFLLRRPIFAHIGYVGAHLAGPLTRAVLTRYVHPLVPCARDWLLREHPTVVVTTHYFNTIALLEARRELARAGTPVDFALVAFLAELYDASIFWVFRDVDLQLVCTAEARDTLARRGVPPDVLSLVRYPLRAGLRKTAPRRARKGANRTLLVSFGAQGIGDPARFVDVVVRHDLPLDVVLITGRNESLKEKLARRYDAAALRGRRCTVTVKGFVADMNAALEAADLCLIKPGPATTMEALYCGKPVVFGSPASFSELRNVRRTVSAGVGFAAGGSRARFLRIMRWILAGDHLRGVQGRIAALGQEDGAPEIAEILAGLASTR